MNKLAEINNNKGSEMELKIDLNEIKEKLNLKELAYDLYFKEKATLILEDDKIYYLSENDDFIPIASDIEVVNILSFSGRVISQVKSPKNNVVNYVDGIELFKEKAEIYVSCV